MGATGTGHADQDDGDAVERCDSLLQRTYEDRDVQVLCAGYAAAVSESRASQQGLQSVSIWTTAVLGGVVAVVAAMADHSATGAYKLFVVAWPFVALVGAVAWLMEFGRLLRAGLLGRRIEGEFLVACPRLPAGVFLEHALELGIAHEVSQTGRSVRLTSGYLLLAVLALLADWGGLAWATFSWAESLDMPRRWVAGPWLIVVLQVVAVVPLSFFIWRSFGPKRRSRHTWQPAQGVDSSLAPGGQSGTDVR